MGLLGIWTKSKMNAMRILRLCKWTRYVSEVEFESIIASEEISHSTLLGVHVPWEVKNGRKS